MHADMIPFHARGGRLYQDALLKDQKDGSLNDADPLFFSQLIWHNDSSKGTFQQRYFSDLSMGTSGICFL